MQLNLSIEGETYKEFYGRNIGQMPLLIGEGRVPLPFNGLLQRRLESLNAPIPAAVRTSYWNNYFDSGDAIVRHTDGRAKIVYDAAFLRSLIPNTPLRAGGVALTDEHYQQLEGPEFSAETIAQHTGNPLSHDAVLANPFWRALTRDDQAFLQAYTAATFQKAQTEFGYDQNMGIYVPSPQNTPVGRLWCLHSLYFRSNAYGNFYLDGNIGRLVGVAPEAQARANLEARIPSTIPLPIQPANGPLTLDAVEAYLRTYPAEYQRIKQRLDTATTQPKEQKHKGDVPPPGGPRLIEMD